MASETEEGPAPTLRYHARPRAPEEWASDPTVTALGAWGLFLSLSRFLETDAAWSLALGWSGEQLFVFKGAESAPDETALVWQLEEADEASASALEEALLGGIAKRPGSANRDFRHARYLEQRQSARLGLRRRLTRNAAERAERAADSRGRRSLVNVRVYMRTLQCLAVGLAVFGLSLPALAGGRMIVAEPMQGEKVRIDGDLREWPNKMTELGDTLSGTGGADPRAAVTIGYDDLNLYVVLKISDKRIVRSAAAGANEDHATLSLAFPRGRDFNTYELELYPGNPGKVAGVVKLKGAPLTSAKIVEAPSTGRPARRGADPVVGIPGRGQGARGPAGCGQLHGRGRLGFDFGRDQHGHGAQRQGPAVPAIGGRRGTRKPAAATQGLEQSLA